MDENDKLDLIAAILAAGTKMAQGAPAGAVGAFRMIRKQLIAEGLGTPEAPQQARPQAPTAKKAKPDDRNLTHMSD